MVSTADRHGGGHNADLPGGAARGLAVVTCRDSRISPLEMLGLQPGDANILGNAGAGVTDDVLRTLVLAVHLLEVSRVMVVAHTDYRTAKGTDEDVHAQILGRGVDARRLEFRATTDQLGALKGTFSASGARPTFPKRFPSRARSTTSTPAPSESPFPRSGRVRVASCGRPRRSGVCRGVRTVAL